MYDADKGIRTGYYYDDMVAPKRDALIVRLRRKGWSQAKIARRLGHTQQGVSKALQRIAEGRLGRDPRADLNAEA
jgi:transcriptional regulator